MKNFIFKSSQDFGLIKNVFNKLEIIQSELRHQRADNVTILFRLDKLLHNANLQKQVDEYFDETSPQTDSDEQ